MAAFYPRRGRWTPAGPAFTLEAGRPGPPGDGHAREGGNDERTPLERRQGPRPPAPLVAGEEARHEVQGWPAQVAAVRPRLLRAACRPAAGPSLRAPPR